MTGLLILLVAETEKMCVKAGETAEEFFNLSNFETLKLSHGVSNPSSVPVSGR